MDPKNDKVSSIYIHNDVSFIILSKLPLKSLKRFTCASKSWSLLFENPNFMKMFHEKFMSMHRSLYNDTRVFLNIKEIQPHPEDGSTLYLLCGENKVNLTCPHDYIYTHMLDSGINDVLCFSDVDHEWVKLWNPATREYVSVPPSPAQVLLFNNVWFNLHGYGYDHINEDYKIIRHVKVNQYIPNDNVDWSYLPSTPHPFWEIYSVRSNSWKRLDLVDMPIGIGRKVYLNGFCHWLTNTDSDDACMVSFDLSSEVFFTTHLPLETHLANTNRDDAYLISFVINGEVFDTPHLPLDMQDSYCICDGWVKNRESDPNECVKRNFDLVVLNGFVAMISYNVKTYSFHIYVLGEFQFRESWTELFIVSSFLCLDRPIGVGNKGGIFFMKDDNKLAYYDLNTETVEDLDIKEEPFCCDFAIYRLNLLPFHRKRN